MRTTQSPVSPTRKKKNKSQRRASSSKKTMKKQPSGTTTIKAVVGDDDSYSYSNSLYARRNSLMQRPSTITVGTRATSHRNLGSKAVSHRNLGTRRRRSMSALEDSRGEHLTAKERLCAFLHIGKNNQNNIHTQQQHDRRPVPASQYTYYHEPYSPNTDNRRHPIRNFFARRRHLKHELFVCVALGAAFDDDY